jgi:phospholipid/cholesterol/gamma-HCH transport system permease protein
VNRAAAGSTSGRARGGGREEGTVVLRPAEEFDRRLARAFWTDAARTIQTDRPHRMVLDLSEATRIDGAGVAVVRELAERCRKDGIAFSVEGAAPAVSAFLDFVRSRSPEEHEPPAAGPARGPRLSDKLWRAARGVYDLAEFVGRFADRVGYLVAHPRELRLGEVLYQIQKAGAEGMWLLLLLSLLLGVIMAFQGLTGARSFGSPLVVADVVTLSTTREMAPLLTGVLLTGRSGAAIAAEIGSMKIHQELDALSVMGFDAMPFLFVPRTLALAVAVPLLTLLSIAAGILGGAAVALFSLHLGATAYFSEVQKTLSASQIASALTKGATFGVIIGIASCFEGLRAGRAAEDVGKQTTAAVVRGILAIIFADAFFSIVSEVYRW